MHIRIYAHIYTHAGICTIRNLYYSQPHLLLSSLTKHRGVCRHVRGTHVCVHRVYIRLHAHIYVYTHIYKYTRTYIHTRGCTIHTRTSFLYVPPSCKPSTALRTQRSVCTFKYFVLPKSSEALQKDYLLLVSHPQLYEAANDGGVLVFYHTPSRCTRH